MTFHTIVENWCKSYKYMQHNPKNGNRRFFLADTIEDVKNMPKNIATKFTPCVVMENGVEGDITDGKITRIYPVYFFVRAKKQADPDALMVAYEEAWGHAKNFYSWLYNLHENDESKDRDYSSIDFEHELYVQPIQALEDGWVAVLIQFTRLEPITLCIDPALYISSPE